MRRFRIRTDWFFNRDARFFVGETCIAQRQTDRPKELRPGREVVNDATCIFCVARFQQCFDRLESTGFLHIDLRVADAFGEAREESLIVD
jgi:hypothetical protein